MSGMWGCEQRRFGGREKVRRGAGACGGWFGTGRARGTRLSDERTNSYRYMHARGRLGSCTELMAEKRDGRLSVVTDFHESNNGHFQTVSGFTGSAGTVVLPWTRPAWTGGICTGGGTMGSEIRLDEKCARGMPTVEVSNWRKCLPGGCLKFDGRTVNAAEALALNEALEVKYVR